MQGRQPEAMTFTDRCKCPEQLHKFKNRKPKQRVYWDSCHIVIGEGFGPEIGKNHCNFGHIDQFLSELYIMPKFPGGYPQVHSLKGKGWKKAKDKVINTILYR